jgi:hypothetical protein
VKKKSLVESLELCTDTPIFLQANMADYGAQGGYGGDQGGFQQQDPNLVGGGQGGYDQQQAGGYDQEAIKQQKFQEVEQDPNLTAEEKKHRRHKIEEELAAGLGVAAVGYEGYKHHEKKKGEEASGEKKHSFF